MEYVPKEETFFEEFYNDLKEYKQLRVLVIIVAFFTLVFCCVGFRQLWRKSIRRLKCIRKCFRGNKTAHFHEHKHGGGHGHDHAHGHGHGDVHNNHGEDKKIGEMKEDTVVTEECGGHA